MSAIAMRMRTHKGLTAIQQGIALLRRLGDRASAFIPGVATTSAVDQTLGTFFVPGGYDNTIALANGGFYTNVGTAGQTRACMAVSCVVGQQYTLYFNNSSATPISVFIREGSDGYGTIISSVSSPVGATSVTWVATNANMCVLWNFNPPAAITVTNVKLQNIRYLPYVQGASLTPTAGAQSLGPNTATVTSANMTGAVGYTPITGGAASIGSMYFISYAYNVTSGAAQANVGGVNCPAINGPSSGSYSGFVTATASTTPTMYSNAAVGTVSNYSVCLVTTSPSAAWLMDYVESTMATAASTDGPVGSLTDGSATIGSNIVTNPGGPFASTTGWSSNNSGALAVTGGVMTVTNPGANYGGAVASIPTVAGKRYVLEYSAYIQSGSLSWLLVGDALGGNSFGTITLPASAPSKPLTWSFVATSSTTYLTFQNNNVAGYVLAVASITAKQVTGIHATQGTSANRPTLRRGLVNQQIYSSVSSGIANSTYVGGSTGTGVTPTITPNYAPDPFGGNTACRVQLSLNGGTTTSDRAYLSGTAAALDLAPRTAATWVRTISGTATLLTRYNGNTLYYTVDTNWQLIWVVGNSTTDPTHNIIEIRGGQSTVNSNTADLLVATHGVFLGAVTPAQIIQCGIQVTTSAAASSSAGNFGLSYNGTSAALALQSLPYSAADDHAVIQGLVPRDVSTTRPSYTAYATNSRYPVIYVGSSGLPTASWRDDAGTGPTLNFGAVTNGTPFVISARKVGTAVYVRKDGGGTLSGSVASLGATTISAVTVGSSPPSSGFWSGEIYPTVIVKGAISDAELLVLERFVGALTGPTGVKF